MLTKIIDKVILLSKRRRDFIWLLILSVISFGVFCSFGYGYITLDEYQGTLPLLEGLLLGIPVILLMFGALILAVTTLGLFMFSLMTLLQRGLVD